jgi:hypothetical protein
VALPRHNPLDLFLVVAEAGGDGTGARRVSGCSRASICDMKRLVVGQGSPLVLEMRLPDEDGGETESIADPAGRHFLFVRPALTVGATLGRRCHLRPIRGPMSARPHQYTTYQPDPARWDQEFRHRRSP